LGPFADKKDLTLKPVNLPAIRDTKPVHFAFADWDGDGRVDLLVGVEGPRPMNPAGKESRGRCSVYWFRNTSDTGPPKFAEASHLLDIPEPWELHALTAVDWAGDGRPSLVVSVSKGLKSGEGWWPVASELWLYRSKTDPRAAPERGERLHYNDNPVSMDSGSAKEVTLRTKSRVARLSARVAVHADLFRRAV
jgi:hypothetical protein